MKDPDKKIVNHNGTKDKYILCSGGMDSVCMAYYLLEDKWSDNYNTWNQRPQVVYLDTTIGLSSQKIYVQLLCDKYNWGLYSIRTHENFEDHTKEEKFYSPNTHSKIFNRLKGRQISSLATHAGNPHFYFGSRRAESKNRRDIEKVKYKEDINAWVHNPIYDWKDQEVVEYLKENDIPFNPNWEASHFTDCGCGATANREELIELEAEGYEVFADKIRNLENKLEGDRNKWAWHSFEESEEWTKDSENDLDIDNLMCGPNCSKKSKLKGELKCNECEFKTLDRDELFEHGLEKGHDIGEF